MQIEDNTILIAPGPLHLRLYEEIYKQKGSCMNITVHSLEAYLARQLSAPKPSTASVLYTYAKALSDLSADNAFYESRADYDFLRACHDFMTMVQLYAIADFPRQTKREKDLYEIIEKLLPIDLWVKEARDLPLEDAGQVRILNTERDALGQFFVSKLLAKGAKYLGEPQHRRFYYWAASNPHKEMEVCADAIVANQLDAQSVLVALADPKEKYALAQAFDSRKIPYTFLQDDTSSMVLSCWKAALSYLAEPSEASLMQVLKTFFPTSGYDVRRYLDLFPEGSSLQNVAYVPNCLLSEEQFASLQDLEVQVSPWKEKLEEIRRWDLSSIEAIASLLMDQIPNPDEDDVRLFQGVMDGWNQIKDFVKKPADLHLFIRSLDTLHPATALSSLKGVLVGDRKVISCLHENIFYIGADATSFPGNSAQGGIFDEEYLEKLDYPSLDTRMDEKLSHLKSVLEEPRDLYILSPQSDYEGKSVETSHELNTWLEVLPKFKPAAQGSVNLRPSFQIEGLKSQVFFESEDRVLNARARQLKSYEECPLKNFLQYGLQLRRPATSKDVLRVSSRLVSVIMKDALAKIGKPFYALSEIEVEQLVREDFAFARSILPGRAGEIDTMAALCARRLYWVFGNLKPVCTEMELSLHEGDYRIDLKEELQGLPVRIEGSMGSSSARNATFNLYESGDSGFSGVEETPAATLDFSLQPKASVQNAFSLSYGRGAQANAVPVAVKDAAQKAQEDFLRHAMTAQNFGEPKPGFMQVLAKKVPTYSEKEQDLVHQADFYASGIVKNEFTPVHKPSACQHCPYRPICRNAAIEKGEAK